MKAGILFLCSLLACLLLTRPAAAQEEEIPEDFDGLLVKAEITATMRGGDLEISIAVMDESIIKYATREMRQYLNTLLQDRLADNMNYNPDGPKRPIPFLVNPTTMTSGAGSDSTPSTLHNVSSRHRFACWMSVPGATTKSCSWRRLVKAVLTVTELV